MVYTVSETGILRGRAVHILLYFIEFYRQRIKVTNL